MFLGDLDEVLPRSYRGYVAFTSQLLAFLTVRIQSSQVFFNKMRLGMEADMYVSLPVTLLLDPVLGRRSKA